jgi:hypothetical protein
MHIAHLAALCWSSNRLVGRIYWQWSCVRLYVGSMQHCAMSEVVRRTKWREARVS